MRRSGSPAACAAPTASVTIDDGEVRPCFVEAIVTVDQQGRIPWRYPGDRPEAAGVAVGLGTDGETIELRFDPGRPDLRRPDRQGRLHVPLRLLHATGMSPGGRVAVVRLPASQGVALVAATRLGVREPSRAT